VKQELQEALELLKRKLTSDHYNSGYYGQTVSFEQSEIGLALATIELASTKNDLILDLLKLRRGEIADFLVEYKAMKDNYKAKKWDKMDLYKLETERQLQAKIDLLDNIIKDAEAVK
jgi:hypothetical protein